MTDTASKSPPASAETLKIVSVNTGSLRRALREGLKTYLDSASPDIFACQATGVGSISANTFHIQGYHGYFYYPAGQQDSVGTAVYTKIRPIAARFGFEDAEARVIVLEFTKFFFVSVHFPQAGEQLENLRSKVDEFGPKVADLVATLGKPAIVGGDFAVAHRDLDVYDAADKEAVPGFTPGERAWFDNFLSTGLIDTYRARHPDRQEFTYFARRFGRKSLGNGWRYGYFLAAQALDAPIVDSLIESAPVFNGHVPIVLLASRDLVADDQPVTETAITVLNTDETIAPIAKRPPRTKIDERDLEAIRAERRTTMREAKPVSRLEVGKLDEPPKKKKTKLSHDDEEYGKSARAKKPKKKPK